MPASRPADSPRDSEEHIGLLVLGNERDTVLPTVVGKRTADTGQDVAYDQFEIGSAVNVPSSRRFRGFKGDLHKKDSALNKTVRSRSVGGLSAKDLSYNSRVYADVDWEMTWGKGKAEGRRLFFQLASENARARLLSPLDVTEVFLAHLCTEINNALRRQLPNLGTIYYRFTRPFYTDKDDRDQYRDHIKHCVASMQESRHYPNSEFLLAEGEWQYEQYGVYFYYAGVEGRIDGSRKGDTYLIVDVGGSTTDLAFIQVFARKDRPEATPVAETIKFAGRDIDGHLAREWLGSDFDPDDDDILLAVEAAKIALCLDPSTPVDLEWNGHVDTWTYDTLSEMLSSLWSDGDGPIRQGLEKLIADAEKKGSGNQQFKAFDTLSGVFLAGGSSSIPGLENLIRDVLGRYVSPDVPFVQPQAPRSTLAAIGLAWQVGNRLGLWTSAELNSASWLAARISAPDGSPVSFLHRGIGWGEGHPEIADGVTFLGQLDRPVDEWAEDAYIPRPVPASHLEGDWELRLFNDLYDAETADSLSPLTWRRVEPRSKGGRGTNGHSVRNTDRYMSRIEGSDAEVSFNVLAKETTDSLRLRPYLRAASHPHEQLLGGSFRVPTGPPGLALAAGEEDGVQTAHVCIDLGMSNTAIAVLLESEQPAGTTSIVPLSRVLKGQIVRRRSDDEPTEEPDDEPTEEPDDEPTEELDDEPTEELDDEPTEELDDEPTEELDDEPTEELDDEPTEERARREAIKTVEELREMPCPDPLRDTLRRPKGWTDQDLLERYQERLDVDAETVQLNLSDGPDLEQLVYPESTVRTVLAEVLKSRSRLVVLAGPPGTGKSRLVRAVAHFLNGDIPGPVERDLFYHLEPVSPVWMDPSGLSGWYSEIDGRFHPTGFWEAMNRVRWHNERNPEAARRRTFCICLDEFNLARPEQYLSEILSRMEAPGEVPDVPVARYELEGLADLALPPNVKLFATLNIDAAAPPLSPKVLDRSCFVHLNCTEATVREAAAQRLVQAREGTGDGQREVLEELQTLLLGATATEAGTDRDAPKGLLPLLYATADAGQSPLGYRVLNMALDHAVRQASLFSPTAGRAAFAAKLVDDLLCAFFLPRLPSTRDTWLDDYKDHVEALSSWCKTNLLGEGRAPGLIARLATGSGQTAWPRFRAVDPANPSSA